MLAGLPEMRLANRTVCPSRGYNHADRSRIKGELEMNLKSLTQMIITLGIVAGYLYLVFKGKANIEGFAVLAMYVIKKFLDIVETNSEGQK